MSAECLGGGGGGGAHEVVGMRQVKCFFLWALDGWSCCPICQFLEVATSHVTNRKLTLISNTLFSVLTMFNLIIYLYTEIYCN